MRQRPPTFDPEADMRLAIAARFGVSSSAATPEIIPVNSPVAAKKTGLLEASANTGSTVSVNVSDAGRILETAGSTSDLKSHSTVGLPEPRDLCNRLPA